MSAPATEAEAPEQLIAGDARSEEQRSSSHVWLLILICGVCDATYTSIAPFFPQRALERGLSATTNGFIFSVFMVGGLVFVPVATHLSRTTGSRVLLTVCILLEAGLTAAFALSPLMHGPGAFFAFTFGLRLAQGVVATVYEVAVSALILRAVPSDRVGAVVGMQESARGVGMMIGPSLGGVLYGVGGFVLPFLASALALALLGVVVLVILPPPLPKSDESEGPPVTIAEVALRPPIAVTVAMLTSLAMALSVLDPVLGPHEHDQFNLEPSAIGLIFSAATITYALCSPLAGVIGERVGNFRVLVVGMLVTAASFQLMGPSPWAPKGWLPTRVWLLVVAMVVMGCGASTLTCAVPCMLAVANGGGLNTDAISDVVGGLLSFAWSVGALVGPLYGSAVVQSMGFSKATSVTGVALLGLTGAGTVLFCATYTRLQQHTSAMASRPALADDSVVFEAPFPLPPSGQPLPSNGATAVRGTGAAVASSFGLANGSTAAVAATSRSRAIASNKRRTFAAAHCSVPELSEPLIDPTAARDSDDERD